MTCGVQTRSVAKRLGFDSGRPGWGLETGWRQVLVTPGCGVAIGCDSSQSQCVSLCASASGNSPPGSGFFDCTSSAAW